MGKKKSEQNTPSRRKNESKITEVVNIFAKLVDGLKYQAEEFRLCLRE